MAVSVGLNFCYQLLQFIRRKALVSPSHFSMTRRVVTTRCDRDEREPGRLAVVLENAVGF